MTAIGHIENGKVVLDEAANFPEGIKVIVQSASTLAPIKLHPEVVRWSGVLPEETTEEDYYASRARKHQ